MKVISLIKKPNILFGFFYKYWLSIILLLILSSLFHQSFIDNNFPFSLYEKRNTIDQNIAKNQKLDSHNKALSIEISTETSNNMEVLESMARARFGLIKEGEIYYQVTNQSSQ